MKLHATPIQRVGTLVIVAAAVGLALPLTPPRDAGAYNLLSSEQEAQMGVQAFEQLKKEKKVMRSGAQVDMVNRVSGRLQRIVSVPHAKWEFLVFEDPTPNAFALPGGKVGIHSGFFQVTENESQLAAVIGHELAHVTLRHAGKRVSRNMVGSTVGGLLGMVLQRKTGIDPNVAQQVTQGAVTLRVLQFSREQEFEADRTGAIYMARAGYDPREAIALWKRMASYKAKAGASAPVTFLSSHPLDDRRIQGLQQVMPEALAHYNRATGQTQAPASAPAPVDSTSSPPKALRYQGGR